MSRAYTISTNSMTIFFDGRIFTLDKTNPAYEDAKAAILKDDWDSIPAIVDKATRVNNYAPNKLFSVVDGEILINGEEIPAVLSERILSFIDEGAPYKPLIKFWNRLRANPSFRARNELYSFIESSSIGILDDGRLLCYKVVGKNEDGNYPPYNSAGTSHFGKVTVTGRSNKEFIDLYTRKVQQGIGDVVSMARAEVDDDSNRTCSHGLHVASWSYMNHYGSAHSGRDIVVEVAVDPADVVSIPSDYNDTKMRCSKYQVLGVNEQLTERRQAYVSDYSMFTEDEGDTYEDSYDDDDQW